VRINWRTVGRIIQRVSAAELDPDRLDDLFEIGIDEVSWRKGHRYLTLVTDHQRRRVVWGAEGASAEIADEFFAQLTPERCQAIEAISLPVRWPPNDGRRQDFDSPTSLACYSAGEVQGPGCRLALQVARPVARSDADEDRAPWKPAQRDAPDTPVHRRGEVTGPRLTGAPREAACAERRTAPGAPRRRRHFDNGDPR
jgi:Transposase